MGVRIAVLSEFFNGEAKKTWERLGESGLSQKAQGGAHAQPAGGSQGFGWNHGVPFGAVKGLEVAAGDLQKEACLRAHARKRHQLGSAAVGTDRRTRCGIWSWAFR